MCRKTLTWGALAALVLFVAVGREATSYVRTCYEWTRDSVKSSIPLDFEIDRARSLLKNLLPDIRANMHLIAKEEVEVQKLDQQIAEQRARLDKDQAEILRMKGDLESGSSSFKYAKRTYTVEQVKHDLTQRFERFKTQDATVNSLEQMRAAREKSLAAARQKLENMLATRRQLEVDVEHLEARLKMVEAAQTTSAYQFNDTQLSRAKELITDLRTRLDVAERLLDTDAASLEQIPLDTPTDAALLDQIGEYFGRGEQRALVSSVSP